MLSLPPVSTRDPSGEKATPRIGLECQEKFRNSLPSSADKRLTERLSVASSTVAASGERATLSIEFHGPENVRSNWPFAADHNFTLGGVNK